KGNMTALDFIEYKYGEEGTDKYKKRVFDIFLKSQNTDFKMSKGKLRKLQMSERDIPENFIDRDIRNTQYIVRKAISLLKDVCRDVLATTGSVTDKLREDWQIIDVLKELNYPKYEKMGLTETIYNNEGKPLQRIIDWTKRNDHRHHAMDAITVAFTKHEHIHYLNTMNSIGEKPSNVKALKLNHLEKNGRGTWVFKPPMPLQNLRKEVKDNLEQLLVSLKAKNKVATLNVNKIKKKTGIQKMVQLTPRGSLHKETVYGTKMEYVVKKESINGSFNEEKIKTVAKQEYQNLLLKRLHENGNDSKKAFTGKNSLKKSPIYVSLSQNIKVPDKVNTVTLETVYTTRKPINSNTFSNEKQIEKIVDSKLRKLIWDRFEQYGKNAKEAFANLEENPIWLNKEKGIQVKRVTVTGVTNVLPLGHKHDYKGLVIIDSEGNEIPSEFVSTGNNHHVAIYEDHEGNYQENVVSFYEAVERTRQGLPVIDYSFNDELGWKFMFTMKQNEMFVFPNQKTGFNPAEFDLKNPVNYSRVSPNLYRVQKFTTKDYVFRHHLETEIVDRNETMTIIWHRLRNPEKLKGIVKVRINHLGEIVHIGEY
ncbi:MAG: type II CRISPR RNA-guided endonuclease Cas9, partial [Cyclobacteriaceae bacterium]|nr:type II CRISPR RNA-guided endonuclease Cas9 [Cyclobacteriaceae bacterium]